MEAIEKLKEHVEQLQVYVENLEDAIRPFALAGALVHADASDKEPAHHIKLPSVAFRKAKEVYDKR